MLYCGHGDTIVLHLPGGRCCLIDCNLKTVSTRDNLFHFFASNKVDRLEFVALSHYDSDHYWGMAEVLDYFTSEGRSIGCVYLPPLNHKYALSIIKAPDVRQPSEATQLQRLDDRLSSGKFQISYVTSGHERFLFQGRDFDFHFLALAPDAKSDHRIVVAGYKRFAKNLDVDVSPGDVNALSAVWAVYIRNKVKPAKSLVLLLAGDLSEEEWIWALDAWRRKSSECGCPSQFRAVKIPHHGSFNSHSEELLDFLPSEGSRYGLISVGTDFPSLPDRRVVEAYLNRGVEVATTFRRTALSRPRAINILDVARRRFCGEGVCNDIVGVLGAEGEVAFSPPEAFIKRTELGLYDTSNG
jgi:hypothetical protein